MSPFRTRHSPSASPHPPTSPEDVPPHAPPSRIPVSKSTSSLSLFRTRSRGNELEELGAKSDKDKGSSSPEWTIRAVTRRRGSKNDEDQSPRRGSLNDDTAPYPTYSGQEQNVPPPSSHPHQPNKLSKWLSRSTSSASAASNYTGPPHDAPPPDRPTTRTTRSRSIGSLNLLSGASSKSPPAQSAPPPADPFTAPPPHSATHPPPAPPSISISSSPSTHFSPSPTSSPALASSSASSSPILASSPPDRPPADPFRRGSVASTSTTKSGSSLRSLGVGGLKVRTRKSSKAKRDLQHGGGGGGGPPLPSSKKGKERRSNPAGAPSASAAGARDKDPLDDWATADLSDGDEEGRIISEEMVRAVSRGSTSSSLGRAGGEALVAAPESGGGGGGGVLAKSLRRTRSGLKLFGGGVARSREASSSSGGTGFGAAGAGGAGGEYDGELLEPPHPGPGGAAQHVYGSGAGGADSTNTSVSPTPTSAVFPSSASGSSASHQPYLQQQQQQAHQSAAGRIGGWFSSMLHGGGGGGSSSSTHLPLPADDAAHDSASSAPSSPEKTRRGPFSPSPASPGSSLRLSSPQKKGSVASALSPSKEGSGGRLGAFDRILDRAAQYFFDSDSKADECTDEIWVLGVRHPGHAPPLPVGAGEGGGEDDEGEGEDGDEKGKKRRSLPSLGRKSKLSPVKSRKGAAAPPPVPALPSGAAAHGDPFLASPPPASSTLPTYSPTPSSDSLVSSSHPPSPSPSPTPTPYPMPTIHGWPPSFYHDFYSRIALTYRTGFPLIPFDPSLPIPTPNTSGSGVGAVLSSLGASVGRGGRAGGAAPAEHEGEGEGVRGLNTDTGWGCMLRTGQSLLANALGAVHLGRDWRRPLSPSAYPPASSSSSSTHLPLPPSSPSSVPDAATYARLLSLFLDVPSTSLSPFSVHAFAAQGRLLGKAPGEWFGPSTAAGAIKALVNGYEPAGLRVVSCVDGAVYESEVAAESRGWTVPVLVLVNVRLGIDGVNPIYHEAIKGIFRLPQTVGIAGGRPSSSYYFVGSQANSLFYIDPHHPRPAVPVVVPPPGIEEMARRVLLSPPQMESGEEKEHVRKRVDTQETAKGVMGDSFVTVAPAPTLPSSSDSPSQSRVSSSSRPADPHAADRAALDAFLASAYSDSAAWSTYHAEKVRKCALNSLDPSMLLGFLVQGEEDWKGFRKGVEELFHASAPIFSIANSPPSWMRRSASSSVPPPNSATAADDSFDDLAASPVLEGAADERPESSTGFSEPDDWELDSTDGLSASPSPSGASAIASGAELSTASGSGAGSASGKQGPAAAVDEGWEDGESSSPGRSAGVSSATSSSGRGGEASRAVAPAAQPPRVEASEQKGKGGSDLEAEGWEGV
ncbi:hypothetical protein JCM6882_004711 [Rhodosporidiobolus microsporus]